MNPAIRLVQLALASMGYPTGDADGWWGPFTDAAARAMHKEGPVRASPWATETLHRGLAGLGYLPDDAALADPYKALGDLIDNGGAALAEAVTNDGSNLTPSKPLLVPAAHDNVLRQGGKGYVIDTFCLHCVAVPGDWHKARTNRQIAEAIHRMHTDPESRGGRGWSDTGYHSIGMPDGEVITGRPIDRIGAGAIGYNRGVYHHVMVEVATITRKALPEDYFTPETLAAAKGRIEWIGTRTQLKRLMGHREVAAKICPGFDVIDRDWTDRAVT